MEYYYLIRSLFTELPLSIQIIYILATILCIAHYVITVDKIPSNVSTDGFFTRLFVIIGYNVFILPFSYVMCVFFPVSLLQIMIYEDLHMFFKIGIGIFFLPVAMTLLCSLVVEIIEEIKFHK